MKKTKYSKHSCESFFIRNEHPDNRSGKEWVRSVKDQNPAIKWKYKPEMIDGYKKNI